MSLVGLFALAFCRSWALPWPYGPVDGQRTDARPQLSQFFDWHGPGDALDERGLREILNIHRRSDGLPNMTKKFFRMMRERFFGMHGNRTLRWDEFTEPYLRIYENRNYFWMILKSCGLAQVRRLPQLLEDCPPRRYMPRNEKELEVTH